MEENTPVVEKKKNAMGTVGFVMALLGLVFSWIPILNILSWIFIGLGLIFSIIGLCKKNAKKGLAITGLILSIIAVIIVIIIGAAAAAALSSLTAAL